MSPSRAAGCRLPRPEARTPAAAIAARARPASTSSLLGKPKASAERGTTATHEARMAMASPAAKRTRKRPTRGLPFGRMARGSYHGIVASGRLLSCMGELFPSLPDVHPSGGGRRLRGGRARHGRPDRRRNDEVQRPPLEPALAHLFGRGHADPGPGAHAGGSLRQARPPSLHAGGWGAGPRGAI